MRPVEPVQPVEPADGASIGATLDLIVDLLHQVLARLGAAPVRALTVPQAADALNVSPATAWEMIAAGELASVTVHGRSRRVPLEAIDAYLAVRLAAEGHGGVAALLPVPVPVSVGTTSTHSASRVVPAPVASYHPTRQRVKVPKKGQKAS